MSKHKKYKTLYDEEFEIESLPPKHKAAYFDIKRFYNKKPDWSVFGNYWHAKVDSVFKRKTKTRKDREKVVNSALWEIAQDLEGRLGIEQGYVRLEDDTDIFRDIIEKDFGSDFNFCKKAGINRDTLYGFLRDKKTLSLKYLIKFLDKLGYEIKFKKKIGNSTRKKIRDIGPTQRKIRPDKVAKALRAEKIPFESAPPFVKYGCWKKLKGG